jgi:peptidoglycan/LPS O-acetylase OafA/YrhL
MRNRSLDGLRAFAVLAVVANHVGLPLTQGGYLGVDVFFVLSGYLITSILAREHEGTGRVALGRFYLRRALRLYPALLVVIALTGVLVALGLVDGQGYGLHAAVAAAYLQDFPACQGELRPVARSKSAWAGRDSG